MEWEIIYYNEALQEEILNMPAGIQARYIHLTERMRIHGANLGMPHTRAMKDGSFELRMKSMEGMGRVFYCTLVHKRIVMLHSFDELLNARMNAGLTQAEVADRMGTKTPAIARLEAGGGNKKHSPSISTLQKYAKAVGCHLEIRLVQNS